MSSQPWSGSHAQGFFRLLFSREMFPNPHGRRVSSSRHSHLPWDLPRGGQRPGKRGRGLPVPPVRAASGREGRLPSDQ